MNNWGTWLSSQGRKRQSAPASGNCGKGHPSGSNSVSKQVAARHQAIDYTYVLLWLRARLDAAIAKSGRSIADEIRTRVEQSLDHDVADKSAREWADGIALMPAEIEKETGAVWHKHLGAWRAFRRAILERLARSKPGGTIKFGARPHQTGHSDDPEEIGIWVEMRLREDPGWTSSQRRKLHEDGFQRIKELKEKGIEP
jgi:hypothetical protein